MCCFSRPVERVADTSIFARSSKEGRQYVVYSMRLSAKEDLAMILPIPVKQPAKEDAVKFINLETYPKLFDDLRRMFPAKNQPTTRAAKSLDEPARPKLAVVEVGSFEASFVPAIKEFDRLDERFKLPTDVWKKIGRYDDFGFVVFKLKKGDAKVHPMAFDFPRADATKLFFPTVHIHDGKVHDRAGFDHALYLQLSGDETPGMFDWEESPQHAGEFVQCTKTAGIVVPDAHVYRRELRGRYKNADILV
jgi:hypothetical protein